MKANTQQKPYQNLLLAFSLLVTSVVIPGYVLAAGNCSPYLGRASINEFFKDQSNMSNDPDDFVEIKILDTTITSAVFDNWKIRICEDNDPGNNNDADGCSSTISVSAFTEKTLPWIVLGDGNIGRYINFKTGFDAILLDGNDDVIDYLTVDGYNPQQVAGCIGTPPLQFDYTTSAPGASDKFIFRSPDGTGDWDSAPSASAPPTEDDTNDTAPDGGTLPTLSVNNVVVNKGDTASFNFTLSKTVTYDVTFKYQTTGGTAVPDTAAPATFDYVNTSGTITFPANTTTLTQSINVSTNSTNPSTNNTVFFYLYLYDQQNVTINNSYPTGTILGYTSAEWYMDETTWNGTTDEVSDQSTYNNHGTTYNGTSNITGYLCNAGSFDGNNDYIRIPHNSSLNGSSSLTYSAWINPDTWSGGNRQIMAKSVHGGGTGRSQMGLFSESGVLKGRAETAAGRKEISVSLPSTGTWTHVALVFSGNELSLYINGSIAANEVFTTTTLVQTTDDFMISRRFDTNQYYFDGKIDEVLVFQSALPAAFISQMVTNYQNGLNWNGEGRTCPGTLHHFEFIHDGSALTCQPEPITIKACANADCSSLATTNTTLNLSPDSSSTITWAGGETKTFTGSVATTLQKTTPGSVSLGVDSFIPTPSSSPNVICKNSSGTTIGCNLTYNDTGFVFSIPTQTSCQQSGDITINAVRKNLTSDKCENFLVGKTAMVSFNQSYSNPVTGTESASIEYASTDYPLNASIPMKFDSNGQSTFRITYADAGELDITASYTGAAGSTDAGLSLNGSSQFVTKPAKFYVYSDNTNAACPSADPTNADCATAFKKAGETFNLKVRAACADNTKTHNFQLNGMTISSNLVQPSPGTNANLSINSFNFTATDTGEVTLNQAVDEVGVFTFTASLPTTGYLGETIIGTTTLNTSSNIGRFTPDHFNTTVTDTCSGTFTYSGQAFTTTVFARNSGNNPTLNYRDNFAFGTRLSNAGSTVNFANNTVAGTSFTSTDANNGSATGTGVNSTTTYTFPSKETPPTTITIRATDVTDTTISSDGFTEGQTEIRSGRMRLENTFGSELLPLTMPVITEYYSTSGSPGFILNTDDSCSPYDAGQGLLSNFTENLDPGETSATGNGTVSSGKGTVTLSAPGQANYGSVKLIFNNLNAAPSWLWYNWGIDCDNADADLDIATGTETFCGANGSATFGIYRGDDRVIYWREVF